MYIEIATLVSTVMLVILLFVVIWLVLRHMRNSPPTRPDQDIPKPSDQDSTQYSQLVLGDAESPLAVIEPFELSVESRLESLPVSEQQRDGLQAIFRHAPSLAKSALSAKSSTYSLRLSAEATRNIANGSWTMMESVKGGLRGIVIDGHGKIVSQATLVPASSVSMLAAPAAIFQCLAIVTAQYYLPQINRRLQRIEQGIQDIKAHLAAQDKGILASSLKDLKSMKPRLEKGGFQEDRVADLVSLDAIDRDCGPVLEAYREHMERYGNEFDDLTLEGTFSPDFIAATDKAAQHEKAALICLQAIYVKSVTAQFRCAIPSDGRMNQALYSLREIEESLEAWHADQTSFARRFRERIQNDTTPTIDLDDMRELFGNDDTLSKQRKEIVDKANSRQESIIALHDELDQTISRATDHTARQLSTLSEPLTIVVKLNEQREIEEVSKLTS